MANVKITDLTAYTDPVSTDVLPIVDVGADVTKKVSIADLLENAGSGTAAAPGIAFDGDSDTGIYRPGANQVAISTNGTGRLFVDASGNVGIGTASPGVALHVDGDIRCDGVYGETDTNTSIQFPGSDVITFNEGGIESFRVQSNGHVTIGRRGNHTDATARLAVFNSGASESWSVRPGTNVANQVDIVSYNYGTATYLPTRYIGSQWIWFSGSYGERARLDSGGRLLVGTSTARTWFGTTSHIQLEGTSYSSSSISATTNTNSSTGAYLALNKSRGTSVGSNTVAQSNDQVGIIYFNAADGSKLVPAAQINCKVDGTPGTDDMPGRLEFYTTADSASSPTERLRINSSGAFGIEGANFGSAGQVLVSNGSSAAPSWEQITPTAVFGWDHDDDTYGLYLVGSSVKVSNLTGTVDINVQSRIRRCVINDSGVVQYYLDADDSDLKSGDWLRIVETEALDTAYTGTISESTNSLLRVGVPAWAAGTFTLGQRVTHGGSLWECIAATTTATPGAGTVSSDLTGTDGQVVVEIPAFSVRYGFLNGVHTREVKLGCNDALIAQGFQPHPAFIKTDGSYKDAFYIGAYHTYDDSGTGSSVSGQSNTRSQTRATFRTEAEARGTGWHVLSYLELAAIQTLLVCEYQDYNSQRAIGNGADAGLGYGATTGQSDGDGNHSVNSTDNVSNGDDYMAYRGIENLYGRAWQFVDGINVYEQVVYLTNDQTAFDDNTSDGYEFYAQVPSGSGSYQKELQPLADVFLPSVVTGGSDTTYLGDPLWTSTGWRVATVGGRAGDGALVGAFHLRLNNSSPSAVSFLGARLAYAVN